MFHSWSPPWIPFRACWRSASSWWLNACRSNWQLPVCSGQVLRPTGFECLLFIWMTSGKLLCFCRFQFPHLWNGVNSSPALGSRGLNEIISVKQNYLQSAGHSACVWVINTSSYLKLLFSCSVMSDSLWSHGLQPPGLHVSHHLPEFSQGCISKTLSEIYCLCCQTLSVPRLFPSGINVDDNDSWRYWCSWSWWRLSGWVMCWNQGQILNYSKFSFVLHRNTQLLGLFMLKSL